jgi:hypothetical protein
MLQTLKAECKSATRPWSPLPVPVLWEVPTVHSINITGVTGGYKQELGPFAFFETVLGSWAQVAYRGTGGLLSQRAMQSVIPASGAYFVVRTPAQPAVVLHPAATPVDVSRQLAFARHYLSLNATDLARILLVERPTIYAWLDGRWDPKQENRARIRRLFEFARRWQEISRQPLGKLLREPVDGDASLMDHLVRSSFEVAAIDRILELVGAVAEQKAKAKKVRSIREIAKELGFKPISSTQENEQFDRETRF